MCLCMCTANGTVCSFCQNFALKWHLSSEQKLECVGIDGNSKVTAEQMSFKASNIKYWYLVKNIVM